MNKSICVATFMLGAALGSVATWQLLKKKYEQIAQEEIDSVKELYSYEKPTRNEPEYNEENDKDKETAAKIAADKPSIMEYSSKLNGLGYTNYSSSNIKSDDSSKYYTSDDEYTMYSDPYVIPPEEFGEEEEYEKVSLTYYSDGVLADENDEVVDDVDAKVGLDSLDTFGRFEDDAVHIRNDGMKCYYEILRDERDYESVMAEKPHPSNFDE